MKLKHLLVFSVLILIFTLGFVSANENLTDEIGESESVEVLEDTVSGNTFTDIQNAVNNAKDNDVIELNGKYTSSKSEITITKSLTIDGHGATLDGAKKSKILNVKSKSLTLKNINFINSKGSAITSEGCSLTIIDCTFKNNGGELEYIKYEDLYRVKGCENGAINFKNGKLTITGSTFSNNLGSNAYSLGAENSELVVKNTGFSNHEFENVFGTVITLKNTKFTLTDCKFMNNPDAEAIYTTKYGDIINCTFENNRESLLIYGNQNTLKSDNVVNIFDSTFKNNKGNSITVNNCYLNINNCDFINNGDSTITSESVLNINNTRFIGNTAKNGGALKVTGKVKITNCNFNANSAKYGGTIYFSSHWDKNENIKDYMEIINTTITNSAASINGGAIYTSCCNLKLDNTNITTKSSSKGSQIYFEVGSLVLENSKYASLKKVNKISTKVRYCTPLTTTFNSGKKFSISVIYTKQTEEDVGWWVSFAKVKFKVYTGKKYKIYYSNIKSSDPFFRIDSSLSVGKHKVKIICAGKHFKFKTKTTTITIKKAKTIVKAKKLTAKHKKSKYFNVKIKHSISKKVIPKLKVKIKVYTGNKAKKYIVKTNAKGIAKINTKGLKKGTHKVTITSKNKNYEVSKKSQIIIK